MHINARDTPPSKAFCFIIEYTPYTSLVRTPNAQKAYGVSKIYKYNSFVNREEVNLGGEFRIIIN